MNMDEEALEELTLEELRFLKLIFKAFENQDVQSIVYLMKARR